MLLHGQKLEQILELVNRQAYWTSSALSQELGISRSTVQKCLQELHNAGAVERIHGGVRRKSHGLSAPTPVDERLGENAAAKEKICGEAIKLMPRRGFVYLDAGTTTLPLAKMLGAAKFDEGLMIVTNDLAIAAALAKQGIRHILLGGTVHGITQSISGTISQSQLADYQFEMCFISVDNVSFDGKVSGSLPEESLLKRQAIRQSQQKILLAASSKFVKGSGSLICGLGDFDVWITEKTTPVMQKLCKSNKVQLVCV